MTVGGGVGCQLPIYGSCVAKPSHVATLNRQVSVSNWPCSAFSTWTRNHFWGLTIHHEGTGHNEWQFQSRGFSQDSVCVCVVCTCVKPFLTLFSISFPFTFVSFADDLIRCNFTARRWASKWKSFCFLGSWKRQNGWHMTKFASQMYVTVQVHGL